MNITQQKKRVLLTLLEQQTRPLALPEILQRLGPGYAERSVRRWLVDLIAEQAVLRTGQKRGSRYQAVSLATRQGKRI